MTWDKLTDTLLESGALSADWEQIFRTTPRDRFTPDRIRVDGEWIDRTAHPDRWAAAVASDLPLVTQVYDGTSTPSSSSSMPTVVATMLRHLDVAPGMRVLEVGTGTGWTAGLLASRVGAENVVTIEADPGLAIDARAQLATMGRTPTVVAADGMLGHPAGAPYDRVHLTAAVQRLPGALIEQTRPGGVILVPYGTAFCNGALARLTVADDGESATGPFVEDVAFMWVRDQQPDSGEFDIDDVRYGPSEIDPADVADSTDAAFAVGLRLPDVFRQSVAAPYDRLGTGRLEVWDGISYAHCRLADREGKHAVSQSGPRNLWDEVTAEYRWWQRQGAPGLDRFGLTVSVDGQRRAWLDGPGDVVG
ncbi:rRNA adenine N-6-methyltransferase family protein [Kitasatospora purpeofusca]|uniref:rRNA adenine N-6-methyltransferase family protein n=1 Tax=Kitasatospora purpeofusca TaxID=67352 RepID=UPI002A59CA32|nr:rRNA adenine N-6-methyltransferase family protein [Kitasatospora purpeofusca]MDY0813300.1 rRNA adenine N-6-methyltransferase family protein [Kitasatospora purpeofusca]